MYCGRSTCSWSHTGYRKLCCFFSKISTSFSLIISRILIDTGVELMGLWLKATLLSPFLKISVMSASCQSSGTFFSSIERRNVLFRSLRICCLFLFNYFGGRLSGPDCWWFRDCRALRASFLKLSCQYPGVWLSLSWRIITPADRLRILHHGHRRKIFV